MLLFVVSTLVVFHFALPAGADELAAQGLLWVALVFTALLGLARAWAPQRESGALAAASRTRELVLPILFLPLAIPLVVGGVGASISEEPGRFLAFLGLYDG